MALSFVRAEALRERLWGLFEETGPFLGRDLRIPVKRIDLGETSTLAGLRGLGAGGAGVGRAPRPSYQALYFDTISGSVPAGAQELEFFLEPIAFIGAITEVDVIAEDPVGAWQMKLDVEGEGPIFRILQQDEILPGSGWFRPTPPGFWPETEGIVFPITSPGRRPVVRVRRPDAAQPNLTLRVLIVAHPSF